MSIFSVFGQFLAICTTQTCFKRLYWWLVHSLASKRGLGAVFWQVLGVIPHSNYPYGPLLLLKIPQNSVFQCLEIWKAKKGNISNFDLTNKFWLKMGSNALYWSNFAKLGLLHQKVPFFSQKWYLSNNVGASGGRHIELRPPCADPPNISEMYPFSTTAFKYYLMSTSALT